MTRTSVALAVAIAAVMVAGPRLLLAYVELDGLAMSAGDRRLLLEASALGTVSVLTAGQVILAHHLARSTWQRGPIASAWGLALAATVYLSAPVVYVGLPESRLGQVLPGAWGWWYSVIAVLGVELVAAALAVVAASPATSTEEDLPDDWREIRPVAPPPVTLQNFAIACRHGCGRVFEDSEEHRARRAEAAHSTHCGNPERGLK